MTDEKLMRLALDEAKEAAREGEIPVGPVLVKDGTVLASAHNLCECNRDATAHAELLAISKACQRVGSWRLSDCTLYVTLEPCPMCAGTAVNARIGRVVYGAKDAKAGAMGSLLSINAYPLNHKPPIVTGILEEECRALLREFFEGKRKK
jgi:tRNA(adenine34) deaminase